MYTATIGSHRYVFRDLKTVLAKATPSRSGDQLAGVAAETDEVTRLIIDTHDQMAFAPVRHLTVGGFRDWLLSDEVTTSALSALAPGVTPEMRLL
jgi:ethanolamine ammonia-lyase large subunit